MQPQNDLLNIRGPNLLKFRLPKSLTRYKEIPFTLELAGGKHESGTEFSGELGGAGKLHGFVVNVPVKDGIYSLTTTEREEFYSQSLEQLKGLAKTINIEK